MKNKKTIKISVISCLTVMIVALSTLFAVNAGADKASDLAVTIDTGAKVTLKDKDSDGYYDIGTADELYAFAAAVNAEDESYYNAELV